MMFEVKMDSKRLNREPIIYGLVEKFRSLNPIPAESHRVKIEQELAFAKALDLRM